tara:strand:- start:4320 stop:5015 length:696 start_codon:yes stop_codon:yes gene_type:complete
MEAGLLGENIIFCIQARVKSSRLPAKIFFDFYGEKIISRIISICLNCTASSNIFILTGSKELNQIIEDAISDHNVNIVYGDEENVYERFKNFIKNSPLKFEYFFRITSDNYLIQPQTLKNMAKDMINSNYVYSYIKPLSHFSGELISRDFFLNYSPSEINNSIKDHVTIEIRNNINYNIKSYENNFLGIDHNLNITLDTINDFLFMKKIEKLKLCYDVDCLNDIRKIRKII